MDTEARLDYLLERPNQPTNDAARFVENRVIFADHRDVVYSGRLDSFVTSEEARRQDQISVELWKQANQEIEQLFQMMEQVRAKLAKNASAQSSDAQQEDLDLRSCKWNQVLQEAQKTASRWRDSSGRTSTARRCVEKVGKNSEAFESWLQLLPAGDYGSSVCGVFKVVIGAAGQYSKVQDAAFETLSEIPDIVAGAQRYVDIYKEYKHHKLELRTFGLFRAILRALRNVMEFFADSKMKKIFKSVVEQESYGSKLTESLEEVRKHAGSIKEEASQLSQERQQDQGYILKATYQNSEVARQTSENSLRLAEAIYMQLLQSPVFRQSTAHEHQGDASPHPILVSINEAATMSKISTEADIHSLLSSLGYEAEAVAEDLAKCSRQVRAADDATKAMAASVITKSQFKSFMTGQATSSALLVNGRPSAEAWDGPSPLTLVATELITLSESTPEPYVVKYFCGEHRPRFGVAEAPAARLMASLVGQLLSLMMERNIAVDLASITPKDRRRVEKSNLKALYNVFKMLTQQLPAKSLLLCVIDEISRYEISMLAEDIRDVMRRLTRLASGPNDISFKLLVTSQGRALRVGEFFEGRTLDLDGEVEPDDAAGWKIASMAGHLRG